LDPSPSGEKRAGLMAIEAVGGVATRVKPWLDTEAGA
jgi:hypothetical protein